MPSPPMSFLERGKVWTRRESGGGGSRERGGRRGKHATKGEKGETTGVRRRRRRTTWNGMERGRRRKKRGKENPSPSPHHELKRRGEAFFMLRVPFLSIRSTGFGAYKRERERKDDKAIRECAPIEKEAIDCLGCQGNELLWTSGFATPPPFPSSLAVT